jgi:hypothetical protein
MIRRAAAIDMNPRNNVRVFYAEHDHQSMNAQAKRNASVP